MVAFLLDAMLLLVLLKLVNNGDRDFMTAIVVTIAVSIVAPILAFGIFLAAGGPNEIGDSELVVAVTAAIAIVAGFVMLLLGLEPKKSLVTAVLYATIHFGVAFGLGMIPTA